MSISNDFKKFETDADVSRDARHVLDIFQIA